MNSALKRPPQHVLKNDLRTLVSWGVVLAVAVPAVALAYPGEQLLQFASSYIIAPLGLFALVLALAGSFFRPDMVKHAVYAVILCAVLFFVIKEAGSLMSAFQS